MEGQAADQQRTARLQDSDQDGCHRHAQQHADKPAHQAQRQTLAQEEAHHLPRGRSRRSQQPDLSRALGQGHGQRVRHQERSHGQRHQAEQEGEPGKPGLGAAELLLGVRHRLDHERLGHGAVQRGQHLVLGALRHLQVNVTNRRRDFERPGQVVRVEHHHRTGSERAETRVAQQADDVVVRRRVGAGVQPQFVSHPAARWRGPRPR